MSLFETISDSGKQYVESLNSGSYKFEKPEAYLTPAMKATLACYPGLSAENIDACDKCDGCGELQPDVQCDRCEGTGVKDHQRLEEPPTVSLYNLLDHSEADLRRLLVAVREHIESIENIKLTLAVTYTSICAWAALIESALKEREQRDSEAWAEKTAKEINETVK